MKWEDVFDKYFIINRYEGSVLVFIPGSYRGGSIEFVWTSIKNIEAGVDLQTFNRTIYNIDEWEISGPSLRTFGDWIPMVVLTQEERVYRKIKVLEERFNKHRKKKYATAI